jgi:hypothetical protein
MSAELGKIKRLFRHSHRPEVFWRARKVLTQKEMTKITGNFGWNDADVKHLYLF